MSSALAKCFHTYFRLINIQQGFMEQFKKKLEIKEFEQLVGLETLWQLSFESQNEKAREESRELLVDIHLRLGQNYDMESRREILQKFVEKAMSVLLEASNTIESKRAEQKALSVVQTLSQFLDRYEGKKPIKPEIKFSNFYQYQMFHVAVYLKSQKDQQAQSRIQISQFESIGSIRQKCAAAFGLELNEFKMNIRQALVDPDEDDDKYVRDYGMSPQIILFFNQQYDKNGHPKFLLGQNQDYFELLFALLSKGKQSLLEPVWDLLQRLPVNKKLHDDIKELNQAYDWNNIFDSASTHKLLYSLKIVEELKGSLGQKSQNDQQPEGEGEVMDFDKWRTKFLQLGGFNHLIQTFTSLKIDAIDSKLTLRCIESLLLLLSEFGAIDPELCQSILNKKDVVVLSCLKYIHMIGQFTVAIEKQRGESYEDLQLKKTQKKAAKQKMKQLQMAGLSKQMRQKAANGNDDDSDDEDEMTESINQVLNEFEDLRAVTEKLFQFIMIFIFDKEIESLRVIEQFADLKDFLAINMFTTENFKIRTETGKGLRDILKKCTGQQSLRPTVVHILKVLIIEILPLAPTMEKRSYQLFDQTRRIMEDLSIADIEPLADDFWELIQHYSKDILTSDNDTENSSKEHILNGKLQILKVLLQKYPGRKQEVGIKLVPHILHDCLFEVPNKSGNQIQMINQKQRPKCKSDMSRKAAFNILAVLSRDNINNLNMVLGYIHDFGKQASWRTNRTNDWQITHFDDEKSSTGYVGLKNLGCICYMLSQFQQFFMIPGFRNDLLQVEDPNHDNLGDDENMFYQFQNLLQGLMKSEKQYVNPKGFCHSFKDWEGQPVNVLEQMDAEEFFQMFMDRIETAIKGTPQEKTIQKHFGGTFANEMICQDCPHQYERSEPFLNIGVPVKNKKTMHESLTAFIQGDMLEGDNAYHCAKCDKKIDTLKRTCIKELPKFLQISLKRFEFDFDRMVRVKLNDYLEFPVDLDMYNYTQEGLHQREEIATKKKDAAEAGEEYSEPTEEELLKTRKHPIDYYQYKLKGIVVHTGTADSGHYYSFIRDADDSNGEKWYEFNDNIVRDFDISELSNECFGGEDSYTGANMMQMKTQKWRNAYLCVYERKNQEYVMQSDESEETAQSPIKLTKKIDDEVQLPDEEINKKLKITDPEHPIQIKITQENQKYWQNKFLFGQEYFDFVGDITHFWNMANIVPLTQLNCNNDQKITGKNIRQYLPNPEIEKPLDEILDLSTQCSAQEIANASHEVFKFQAFFYLTILQRNQNKNQYIPKAIQAFKAYINNDSRNGLWLIHQMSNWEIIEEMFLQPLDPEMPKLAVGLIYASMLSIYEEQKDQLNCHWANRQEEGQEQAEIRKTGILGNFILMLVQHIYDVKQFIFNMPHFFQILARFASLGPEAREFLLRCKIIGRSMDFFFDQASPYRELLSNMSDLGDIQYNEDTEIGLPTQVNKKFLSYFQQLQEKKRKNQLAQAPPKYKYLMETVSTCIRHLQSKPENPSQYQLDKDYPYSPTTYMIQQEFDIFNPDAKFLKRYIVEAKRNRSINAVCMGHIHYAFWDQDQVEELFKTVEHGLMDQNYDYDRIRPFLCLLEYLITTKHPTFQEKVDDWLKRFLKCVQQNQNYYRWMEVAFEYIFKFIARYEHIKNWFYNNEKLWKFLYEWHMANQNPPLSSQMNQHGVRLYKNRQNFLQNQMQNFQDQNSNMKNRMNTAYRYRKIKEIHNKKVKDLSNEPDTDKLDYLDFKFNSGDTITIQDRKSADGVYRGMQWKINFALDEMVNCKLTDSDGRPHYKWQKLDSDKIYFGETYGRLNRNLEKIDIWEIRQQQKMEQQANARAQQAAKDSEQREDGGQGGGGQQQKKNKQGGAKTGNDMSSDDYESSDDENMNEPDQAQMM